MQLGETNQQERKQYLYANIQFMRLTEIFYSCIDGFG